MDGFRNAGTIGTIHSMNCTIRNWTSTDRAFIADAWLHTLRGSSQEAKHAEWGSFCVHHNRCIDAILDDSSTSVSIAAPAGDDVTIFGYLVHSPVERLIHMAFVKKPFRRQGIAKKLLSGIKLEGSSFTQWSRDAENWILPKFMKSAGRDRLGKLKMLDGIIYNPYFYETREANVGIRGGGSEVEAEERAV